jgi:chromosome segregation ATPase
MDDQSLAQLADIAPSDPSAFLQLVDALKTRLHGFVMRDQLDIENDLRKELKRVRSHFSNLKGGFLQLETKQRFLTHLIQSNGVESFGSSFSSSVDERINTSKQEIQQFQQSITETQRMLRVSIVDLINKWRILDDGTKNLSESFHPELTTQNKEVIRVLEESQGNKQKTQMDFVFSETGLVNQIAMERNEINELAKDIQRLESDLECLHSEIEPLEGAVDKLRNELKLFKKNGRLSESAINSLSAAKDSAERVQLSATLDWYHTVTNCLRQLTGITIKNQQTIQEDGEIHLRINGNAVDESAIEVAIELNQQENIAPSISGSKNSRVFSRSIIGARLLQGKCEKFDEIMDYAIQTQDLNFLIREIQANLVQL